MDQFRGAAKGTKPTSGKANEKRAKSSRGWTSPEAIRETIESVVVALVLAFLFRTFEAEAFVIPTGSMAPTLTGRHKDLYCPKCGFEYQVNASDEVDHVTERLNVSSSWIEGSTCPLCRYTADLGPDNPQDTSYPSYSGDRIIVNKFAYELNDPERWDVIVFKYPGQARTNYIKRLVGLPGETIKLAHGDVFVRPQGADQFTIARKPPHRLLAMLQMVYDNQYTGRLVQLGWPARWFASGDGGGWRHSGDHAWLENEGKTSGMTWVRYHHLVPGYEQWTELERTGRLDNHPLWPSLITNFTGYNTNRSQSQTRESPAPGIRSLGLEWVGDLALEGTLDVRSATGKVLLELVKGGRRFQCRIDIATGEATLSIDGKADFKPKATTAVRGSGKHRFRFSNCDEQLLLWVDGSVVKFDEPTTYASLGNIQPTPADLEPAGIGLEGASVRVGDLKLWRDLYYIALRCDDRNLPIMQDADFLQWPFDHATPAGVARFLSDPERWRAFANSREVEFQLQADQFFVLGDNSTHSLDSRWWEQQQGCEFYVRRDLLIGRALFIYWPHSWNQIDLGKVKIPFPMFPNFSRMKFVR